MKIQIIGVGVVGTAQAYMASQLGHEVLGFDPRKPASDYARMVPTPEKDVDLTFICTPESAVEQAVRKLKETGVKPPFVVKSTVPPGTTRYLRAQSGEPHICHNPEFLTEKTYLNDVTHPDFVLISECCPAHGTILRELYSPLGCPILFTEPTTSETLKLTLNAYLSTLITFWNEINIFAGQMKVSTREIADIAAWDPRVSTYGAEFFGVPFGGKCLPKDLDQLIQAHHQSGDRPIFLEAVREFNNRLKNAARL